MASGRTKNVTKKQVANDDKDRDQQSRGTVTQL